MDSCTSFWELGTYLQIKKGRGMWAGLLPLLLLPASASFPRGVSFGSASAQQPFPAAGFN